MADLQTLYAAIDELDPQDFLRLRQYVEQRAHTAIWVLTSEQIQAIDEIMRPVQEEAATMTEDEINTAIDEALAEVRNERKLRLAPN